MLDNKGAHFTDVQSEQTDMLLSEIMCDVELVGAMREMINVHQ